MQNTIHNTRLTSTAPERGMSGRARRITLARAAVGLMPAEKLLLRILVDSMGDKNLCWPSLKTLAEEVGVTVRHLRRMLRHLETAGWIESEARFRSDRSQTSNLYRWCGPQDMGVSTPQTCTSALELYMGKIKSKTYADTSECPLENQTAAPAALVEPVAPVALAAPTTPTAPVAPATPECRVPLGTSGPTTPTAPVAPTFIVIDGNKFLDIQEAARVYKLALAGKLLNSGSVDRLAFFSCWCAVVARVRDGRVQHPERMMRFLLDNRKAMGAYPSQADETKAREAVRHLFPEKPYCPHG